MKFPVLCEQQIVHGKDGSAPRMRCSAAVGLLSLRISAVKLDKTKGDLT